MTVTIVNLSSRSRMFCTLLVIFVCFSCSPPHDAESLRKEGEREYAQGNYAVAIDDFNRAISLNLSNAIVYNDRAAAKCALQDYDGCVSDCNVAIGQNSQFAGAYVNRGNARYGLGDYTAASVDYKRAIGLDSNLFIAYLDLSRIKLFITKDYAGVIADTSKAIRLNPKYWPAYYNRGSANYLLRNYDEAVADFNECLALNPKNADAYNYRGATKQRLDDYEGSISDFAKAIKYNPGLSVAYSNRGLSERAIRRYTAAITDEDAAIRLNSGFAEAYFIRGTVEFDLKKYDGAMSDLSEAIKLDPKMAAAYTGRASCKEALGDEVGAKSDSDMAKELENSAGQWQLISILAKEAKNHLDQDAIVTGIISEMFISRQTTNVYMYLDGDIKNAQFAAVWPGTNDPPTMRLQDLVARNVSIRGKIIIKHGLPEIIVASWDQIIQQ